MTRIEFFFNVEHKLKKVCELGEKVVSKNQRLMIFTPDDETARKLSSFLWSEPALGFLPNCRLDDALAAETPIVIDSAGKQLVHHEVLINLQSQYPPFFSRFTRLIEIVGMDEADKAAARTRYSFYRDRGYEIKTFDAQSTAQ
jgi:DNA polymerase III subunit chi